MDICPICTKEIGEDEEASVLTEKGVKTIQESSKLRQVEVTAVVGHKVHVSCRLKFCNKNSIETDTRGKIQQPLQSPVKRRSSSQFSFGTDCFLCGMNISKRALERNLAFPVRTFDFQKVIQQSCDERKDRWALEVKGRIASSGGDLHAADALYHQICNVNFRTGKRKPATKTLRGQSKDGKAPSAGRPKDIATEEAFTNVVQMLMSNDEEQWTISELCAEMAKMCDSPYSAVYMKKKLVEVLGDSVTISNVEGKHNIVTFNNTASKILNDYYQNSQTDTDIEIQKQKLIIAAVALLRSDILEKHKSFSKEFYPDPDDLKSVEKMLDFLPDTLKLFLDELFVGKSKGLKMASLGQCLLQAARPRAIMAPLQIGLAIQSHHLHGSKTLIDNLHAHGLCSSYTEVLKFENCAAAQAPTTADINDSTTVVSVMLDHGHFRQFVCDIADRNPWSIDGRKALHAMGTIETITPSVKCKALIKRSGESARCIQGMIQVKYYDSPNKNSPIMYYKLPPIDMANPGSKLDLLWKINAPLKPGVPNWSGVMQALSVSSFYPAKSTIRYLPMIDLDPTDMSCIFSTLSFITDECIRHGCAPIITFDQPLWFKARTIIQNERSNSQLKQIILDLGGFHTMMSYLSCIGKLMTDSGIREILELMYGENAVTYILNGKSYARACRGHFIIDLMLHAMLLDEVYTFLDVDGSDSSGQVSDLNPDLQAAITLFDNVITEKISVQDAVEDPVLHKIDECLSTLKNELRTYPTAELYLQYTEMVQLLQDYIRSQRTGNWSLQKDCLIKMLPYFAACGHIHYTKSVQIYLQDLNELKQKNPEVYKMFEAGLFVIRRTDRFWAGLSKDLVIEQSLMRTMKVTGGLVHGRGVMDEKQRNKWLLSLPVCATFNDAMQELTGKLYTTSEQHKELAESRVKRDNMDANNVLSFLREHNPFERTPDLRSITSGLTADPSVNAHKAVTVGEDILKKMYGKNVFEFSFTKKDSAVVMGQKSNVVNIEGEQVNIDPQLLFQRLFTVGQNNTDENDIDDLLQYELSSNPPAIFDDYGLIREATKTQLADSLHERLLTSSLPLTTVMPPIDYHVFDGGSLLHRTKWKKGESFDTICLKYKDIVAEKNLPIVVFDGYLQGPSTKDCTHRRRSKGMSGSKVSGFSGDKKLKTKKDIFLINDVNKQNFINLMTECFASNAIQTKQATEDADVLIALTAVEKAARSTTCVIGEDTDILTLLCHHANRHHIPAKQLFFKSEKKNSKRTFWDIGQLCDVLGDEICRCLPFIHAISGCDTTSRLFGIGKATVLNKMENPVFKKQANIFCGTEIVSSNEVIRSGEIALVNIYGGRSDENGESGENLNSLRARKFKDKVVTATTAVEVKTLPPTSDAARFHSLRVFLQVRTWLNDSIERNPIEWGWELKNSMYFPKKMYAQIAPQNLLKVIRCKCTGDCKKKTCSCRRYGLKCSNACRHCNGDSCSNTAEQVILDEEELEEIEPLDL